MQHNFSICILPYIHAHLYAAMQAAKGSKNLLATMRNRFCEDPASHCKCGVWIHKAVPSSSMGCSARCASTPGEAKDRELPKRHWCARVFLPPRLGRDTGHHSESQPQMSLEKPQLTQGLVVRTTMNAQEKQQI